MVWFVVLRWYALAVCCVILMSYMLMCCCMWCRVAIFLYVLCFVVHIVFCSWWLCRVVMCCVMQ